MTKVGTLYSFRASLAHLESIAYGQGVIVVC